MKQLWQRKMSDSVKCCLSILASIAVTGCGPGGPALTTVDMTVTSPAESLRFVDADSVDSGISFFGETRTGDRIAFVLDFSGSMDSNGGRQKLELELAKTLAGIPRNPPKMVALVAFDSAAEALVIPDGDVAEGAGDHWRIATPRTASAVRRQINERATGGGTAWGPGLNKALELTPKPDLIFMMTDGDSAESDLAKVVDDFTKANHADGSPATVVAITTAPNPGTDQLAQLKRLAEMNLRK